MQSQFALITDQFYWSVNICCNTCNTSSHPVEHNIKKPVCVIYAVGKQSSYFALYLLSMDDCLGEYSAVENNLVQTENSFNPLH
jgi:hypothetical protein